MLCLLCQDTQGSFRAAGIPWKPLQHPMLRLADHLSRVSVAPLVLHPPMWLQGIHSSTCSVIRRILDTELQMHRSRLSP